MVDSAEIIFAATPKLKAAFLKELGPQRYGNGFYLKHPYGYRNPKVNYYSDTEEFGIEASLPKLLQGHNVVGTNRLSFLCLQVINLIYKELEVEFSKPEIAEIRRRRIKLGRVDLTCSFMLESQAAVSAALEAIALQFQAEGKFCTTYGNKGVESVYLNIHSTRVAIKFYNKFLELKKSPLPESVVERDRVMIYAERLLRFEVTFRGRELKRLGLEYVNCWSPVLAIEMLKERFARLKLTSQVDMFDATPSEPVTTSVEFFLTAWGAGADFRGKGGYPPIKRARKKLLERGIDILIPKKRTPPVSIRKLLSNSRAYFVAPKALTRSGALAGW